MSEEISPLENHGWWMEQLRKDAKANRPEALRLADTPFALRDGRWNFDADDELRRLHVLNVELLEALKEMLFPYREETAPYEKARDQARAAIAKADGSV
jgi:hypothetical protein